MFWRRKARVYRLVRQTAGRRHGWFESNAGLIRKPLGVITIEEKRKKRMKTLQKAANVACYILSLPVRVAGVIIGFPVVLSNVDWKEPLSRGGRDFKDDLWDILKYPHA